MAWTLAAAVADFTGRDVVGVECRGQRIAVYRIGESFFATSDTCPHQGASLSRGCIVDGLIECPAHFALFDIRTGTAEGGPTSRPIKTFATKVELDGIYVDLDA